jgi:hypothetical protein
MWDAYLRSSKSDDKVGGKGIFNALYYGKLVSKTYYKPPPLFISPGSSCLMAAETTYTPRAYKPDPTVCVPAIVS